MAVTASDLVFTYRAFQNAPLDLVAAKLEYAEEKVTTNISNTRIRDQLVMWEAVAELLKEPQAMAMGLKKESLRTIFDENIRRMRDAYGASRGSF